MDRGYPDFKRLFGFTASGAFFVVQTKSNVILQRRYSSTVDTTTGVRSDHTRYPDCYRFRESIPGRVAARELLPCGDWKAVQIPDEQLHTSASYHRQGLQGPLVELFFK